MPRATTVEPAVPRTRRPRGMIEHDGMLWKPKPGRSVSAAEFITARTTMIEIHYDARWNPWIETDRAAELDQAMATFSTWTRAEPDHHVMTDAEAKETLASWDREHKARRKKEDAARRARKRHYNADREAARLRLLEAQAQVGIADQERQMLLNHETAPYMDDTRRAKAVAEVQDTIDRWTRVVEETRDMVGDPEAVVAADGSLPNEHRERSLFWFSFRRRQEVERLRELVAILPGQLKETKGREPRAKLRNELHTAERELAFWLSIPRLEASEMCSECAIPLDWHLRRGHILGQHSGPCPAWPTWAERVRQFREMILSFGERDKQPQPPAARKPQPVAVLKSGTPIEQVIAELTRISAEHPGAEVRRGNANRWEIWPAKPGSDQPAHEGQRLMRDDGT